MPEVVSCPTCGAPAHARQPDSGDPPVLTALTAPEQTERLAQLAEVVRLQRARLEVADLRIRELEDQLRERFVRPGTAPSPLPTPPPPSFPHTPFQGRAGAF